MVEIAQLREALAVAGAEARSARRLARTWLFASLALLIGIGAYVYYTVIHGMVSGFSATLGFINARFLLASLGIFANAILVVALVFLAFDIRARDLREHMAEVLDSRPGDNFTLLLGRLAGLVFVVWLPLAVWVALVQGVGALAVAFDWGVGQPVEPASILAFLLLDAPVTLALWGAVVLFLAAALRNRLLVVLAALALFAGYVWLFFRTPLYLLPIHSVPANLASDLLPHFVDGQGVLQRLAMLLLAGGFLFLGATVHTRRDDRPAVQGVGIGIGLLLLGGAVLGAIAWPAVAARMEQERWLAVHEANQSTPRLDVVAIAGSVVVDPGERLSLDLAYRLAAPPQALAKAAFSFNPGMTVTALRVDGADAEFEHSQGLLTVSLPATARGEELALSIVAEGVPDPAFAYLDGVVQPQLASGNDSNVLLLGSEAGIFETRFVALMPGTYWLPMPGAAVGREQAANYGRDYFTLQLAVEVPPDWLVAGPGKRRGEGGAFSYRPPAPLPEVALIAAAFERRALTANGVELELLLHPKHLHNAAFFADAAEEIRKSAAELLAEAERLGLGYPYEAFTLAEVPATLRTFGGGWRLGSVQALPGVALLREYGFPTSRFGLRLSDPEDFEDWEGGVAAGKRYVLADFFANDVAGGNPLHGAVGNAFGFLTGARGEGAVALDFLTHELAVQLIAQQRGSYFSAHDYDDGAQMGALFQRAVTSAFGGFRRQGGSIVASVHDGATNQPSVWNRALGAALADLDTSDAELAVAVLWLKVPAIAEAIVDGLGRERVAALLAELRTRHMGGSFSVADFEAAARAVGVDLNGLLGDWLHDAALPGFLVAEPRVVRLADDGEGRPRYQLSVHVRNDEPVPGLVQLAYLRPDEERERTDSTGPVRIPGHASVELGLVARAPPARLWLASYMSLNRGEVALAVPAVDETERTQIEAFSGARPSDWMPTPDGIVVDDLDPGFAVQVDDVADGRIGAGSWFLPAADIDEGLPVYSPFAGGAQWTRQEVEASWGKYRHTLARIGAGDGAAVATFTAALPAAGRWRLAYHLPAVPGGQGSVSFGTGGASVSVSRVSPAEVLGAYDLRLVADGVDVVVEFDGTAAEIGWNDLGDFELPAGEVRLSVSDKTTGQLVVADAIRWRPLTPR